MVKYWKKEREMNILLIKNYLRASSDSLKERRENGLLNI